MKLLDRQPDPDLPPHWDIKEIEGRWPDALRGSLLRSGPALFRRGDETRPYLLDGDGLAQRWIVDGEAIRHQAAWIRTRKFDQETSRRQFVQPGFSTKGVSLAALARTDDFNTANTNLIHFNGSLLALWEAGSAHQLHLDDLSTQGPMVWS